MMILTHTISKQDRLASFEENAGTRSYRFILVPEASFCNSIQRVLDKAGLPGMGSGSVLEIARYNAPPRMEDTLLRWTQRICSQTEGFSLSFNNFGGLPPHTIYLRLTDQSPLRVLVNGLRKLDMYLTGYGYQPLSAHSRFMLPVLTNISRQQYDELLYSFAGLEFNGASNFSTIHLEEKTPAGWMRAQSFALAYSS